MLPHRRQVNPVPETGGAVIFEGQRRYGIGALEPRSTMAPRSKTARITIRTVAEDAGVSPAAVSKVLRDAYGVSPGLRAKVQASIAKLGYRPHAAARGMRGQTYTLG